MKYKSLVIPLIFTLFYACNNGSVNNLRVNPTPVPSTVAVEKKTKFTIPATNLGDELPEPSREPVKAVEEFTFDVEIKFDGVLGRVYVDDGEIRDTPTKYTLKGGNHTIIVFDLVKLCRIAKVFFIDKNTTLDFTGKNSCINENPTS